MDTVISILKPYKCNIHRENDTIFFESASIALTSEVIKKINNVCEEKELEFENFIVTDSEHDILSIDAYTPFSITIANECLTYDSVTAAFNDLTSRFNFKSNVDVYCSYKIMYILNLLKFIQNKEAQKLLLETNYPIIYKNSTDLYWGMSVPEFKGCNVMGEIYNSIRNDLSNNITA
tara:strand:- start:339 stop:869 length:531 start_codon:yes stop_codon:yes gene_type:complete